MSITINMLRPITPPMYVSNPLKGFREYDTSYIFNHINFQKIKDTYRVSVNKNGTIIIVLPINQIHPIRHDKQYKSFISIYKSGYVRTNFINMHNAEQHYPIKSISFMSEDYVLEKIQKIIEKRTKFLSKKLKDKFSNLNEW